MDFDDSIIEDKESERNTDRQDVSIGAMSLVEYRAKMVWGNRGTSSQESAKSGGGD